MSTARGLRLVVRPSIEGPRHGGHLYGIERRKEPFHDLGAPWPIGRHQRRAAFPEIQQDRAALEDHNVSIGEPWHLAKGLERQTRRGVAHGRRCDLIRQLSFLQCPSDAKVTNEAARKLRHPVERGQDELGHARSPSSGGLGA